MATQKNQSLDLIVIRPAEPQHCTAVATLIKELATFEKMFEKAKLTAEDIQRDAFDSNPPAVHILIAESVNSNEIVGYALYFFTYSGWSGRAIHLEDIYIKPQYQSKGVGEKILKYLAKIAYDGNFPRITLECIDWNKTALEFYRKHGAVDVTVSEFWHSFEFINYLGPNQPHIQTIIAKSHDHCANMDVVMSMPAYANL